MTRCTAIASSTRAGEDRHGVHRAAGRHDAARRHAADGRLQPDDVAERSGHAAGTGGIGAEGERHDPGGHRAAPSRTTIRPACATDRTRCAGCRRACACRPGRWRTGRDWSCPAASRRHRASAARRARWCRRCRRSRGRRRWSAGRRRRCCPSPRTGRPRAGGPAGPASCSLRAWRQHDSSGRRVIQMAGSAWARSAASAASAASRGVTLRPRCGRGKGGQ